MCGVVCSSREGSLKKRIHHKKKILPFVIQYHPAVPKLKNILMGKWHLTQNQIGKKIIKIYPGEN